jgi:hypothetical protein
MLDYLIVAGALIVAIGVHIAALRALVPIARDPERDRRPVRAWSMAALASLILVAAAFVLADVT